MIITTPRLTLRPLQPVDIEAMAGWPPYPDPLNTAWNWPHTLQAAGTIDLWFAIYTLDDHRREWAIVNSAGEIIGHVGLRQIEERDKSARLGLLLGCPFRSQGYGSEAMRGFLDAYFGLLGFMLMRLDVAAYNTVGLRLYERIGFRRTGMLWHPLDLTVPATLNGSRYDPIRHLLRHDEHGSAAHHIAMELHCNEWLKRATT